LTTHLISPVGELGLSLVLLFEPLFFLPELLRELASNSNDLRPDAVLYLEPSLLQHFFKTTQVSAFTNGGRSSFLKWQLGEVSHNIVSAFTRASIETQSKDIVLTFI
jgi:hypothetical protein